MDNHQINYILSHFNPKKYIYLGCFANDDNFLLDYNLSDNFFVLNTLNSSDNRDIGHWIGYFEKNNILYFVDSFGMCPSAYGGVIKQIYEKYAYKIRMLPSFQIQNESSLLCGGYVIFFFNKLIENYKPTMIMRKFRQSLSRNDAFIELYIIRIINNEVLRCASRCNCQLFNSICSKSCNRPYVGSGIA